jgi:hypothetical protein
VLHMARSGWVFKTTTRGLDRDGVMYGSGTRTKKRELITAKLSAGGTTRSPKERKTLD